GVHLGAGIHGHIEPGVGGAAEPVLIPVVVVPEAALDVVLAPRGIDVRSGREEAGDRGGAGRGLAARSGSAAHLPRIERVPVAVHDVEILLAGGVAVAAPAAPVVDERLVPVAVI